MKLVSIPVLYLHIPVRSFFIFCEHLRRRLSFFVTFWLLHVTSYIYVILTGYVEVKCVWCNKIYLNANEGWRVRQNTTVV
jgi:hypothetical protein